MDNLYPQSRFTVQDKFLEQHSISISNPAGYLCIADSFCVSIKVKPSEEHLQNMFKTFGWVWKDYA